MVGYVQHIAFLIERALTRADLDALAAFVVVIADAGQRAEIDRFARAFGQPETELAQRIGAHVQVAFDARKGGDFVCLVAVDDDLEVQRLAAAGCAAAARVGDHVDRIRRIDGNVRRVRKRATSHRAEQQAASETARQAIASGRSVRH